MPQVKQAQLSCPPTETVRYRSLIQSTINRMIRIDGLYEFIYFRISVFPLSQSTINRMIRIERVYVFYIFRIFRHALVKQA